MLKKYQFKFTYVYQKSNELRTTYSITVFRNEEN